MRKGPLQEQGKRFDPKKAHRLEDPERLVSMPPNEIVAALAVAEGMKVADVGAGTGYFAIPMARAVGSGKVFAVDVSREMLDLLRAKLVQAGAPANIVLIEGEAENTSLKRESCDLILMAEVWHEVANQKTVLREMKRVLKPGGRLAILDWSPDRTRPPGPPLEHRIARTSVEETLTDLGWRGVTGREIGTYSYLIIGIRP